MCASSVFEPTLAPRSEPVLSRFAYDRNSFSAHFRYILISF